MLSGIDIVVTTILSRILFRRKVLRHHILGCLFSICGFIVVGYAGYLGSKSSKSNYTAQGLILGITLNTTYLFLTALYGNIQELILRKKAIVPMRMVGLEGLFGLIFAVVACATFGFFSCPNEEICEVRSKRATL